MYVSSSPVQANHLFLSKHSFLGSGMVFSSGFKRAWRCDASNMVVMAMGTDWQKESKHGTDSDSATCHRFISMRLLRGFAFSLWQCLQPSTRTLSPFDSWLWWLWCGCQSIAQGLGLSADEHSVAKACLIGALWGATPSRSCVLVLRREACCEVVVVWFWMFLLKSY